MQRDTAMSLRLPLTIVFSTARLEPKVEWVLQSLRQQILSGESIHFIMVDGRVGERQPWDKIQTLGLDPDYCDFTWSHTPVRPNVWQGEHRLTKENWWAASAARNSGICLCKTPWIAFLDDRSVLLPGWLQSIRHAMIGGYVVCGPYEKVFNLKVEDGSVMSWTEPWGEHWKGSNKDSRLKHVTDNNYENPFQCGGEWLYGCNLAMPLDWALRVGGYDETCDGLSGEDTIFGLMLQNNGYPIKYDVNMAVIQDRTPL